MPDFLLINLQQYMLPFPSKSNHSGQTHSSTLGFICSLHISGFCYSVLDLSLISTLENKLAATDCLMAFLSHTRKV